MELLVIRFNVRGSVLRRSFSITLLVFSSFAAAQTWTVNPAWVKAHEDFLASDAMRGRGSATHDEQVTAEYIASEFEGYGLKPAPGMTGYIQSAALDSTILNGHSKLVVGTDTFEEGKDYDLLVSSGYSRSGRWTPIQSTTPDGELKDMQADVIFLSGVRSDMTSVSAMRNLSRAHVSTLIVPEDSSTDTAFARFGGKPHMPLALAGEKVNTQVATILAMHPDAYKRMQAIKQGTEAALTVFGTHMANRSTYNAIGYLPGSDPAAGTILLSAHLDHLGVGQAINDDSIWNGANDDASGTTAVLELAHALAAGPKLRRSVLFVCYGSEELGEFGSRYFGAHPPVPLKDLVANLEIEMIGNQDPQMPAGTLSLTGYDRSNLGPTLKDHGALLGPDLHPEQHYFERSDNYQLALKGVVAQTATGWGDPPTYHQPDDDVAHLDLPFMTAAIQSLIEPIRWMADGDFIPKWNHGGQPKAE